MKGTAKGMIGLIVYVCLSATALTLIKLGLGKDSTLLLDKGGFNLNLSWMLVGGALMYVVSFCLSMVVMKGMDLSLFYPLSAGLIYVVVCLLSFLVLKEKITTTQLIGMVVILAGIIIMNLGKK
jgi:small multidrug resistance pump